jgi:hypothetical protein
MMRGRLALAGAAVLTLAATPGAGATPVTATTPVANVSATPNEAEGEEYVAINPANPTDVVVGSNQWQPLYPSGSQDYIGLGPSGFTRCAVWVSGDGGQTWSGGAISNAGLGPETNPFGVPPVPKEFDDPGNVFSADQSTVFDRAGTAWYACLDFGVKTGVERLDVWRSDDGGKTWSGPVPAYSQLTDSKRQMDRPWLAIDQTGGPRDGTLYMSYENIFYDPVDPGVYVRSSADGGQTWGQITRVDTGQHPAMMDARVEEAVGADGTLYVMYDSATAHTEFNWAPQAQQPNIVLAASTDGGKTFSYQLIAQNVPEPTPPDEDEVELTEFIPSLAADPAHPGHLAIAWPQMVSGSSRILTRSSIDGGRSWTSPQDVADDAPGDCPPSQCPPVSTAGYEFPPGQGNEHDHVEVRYLPDGSPLLEWRDRRYTGGSWSQPWDIFARKLSLGSDGTLTPGTTVRVTTQSQTPTTTHRGHMPSEYIGLDVTAAGVGFSWDAMAGLYPDNFYRFIPLSTWG